MERDTTRASAPAGETGTPPMMDQLRDRAGDLAEQARDQIKGNLSNQKKRTSRSLDRVAHALRQTGQQLSEENEPKFGEYANRTADWVEDFAASLRDRDIEQVFHDVEEFGRRRPAVFLGGAFLLGFLAARFFKASGDQSNPSGYASRRRSLSPSSSYFSQPSPSPVYSTRQASSSTPPAAPAAATAPAPTSYAGAPRDDARPIGGSTTSADFADTESLADEVEAETAGTPAANA